MRLRIDSVDLVGTQRRVQLGPGLNIIAGPITTGKTSFLRLCRVLVGAPVVRLPPEIMHNVEALAGRIVIGGSSFSIVRRLVSTETARVEIAGQGEAHRLPALRPDSTFSFTYGQWLLDRLGLPQLQVPTAPTRPAESATTPVTINDYFLYCYLPQTEIDVSVFGHRDHYRDIKRRYVFEILYGLYDIETARLQDELRRVYAEIRQLQAGAASFERFLVDTPWENRAEIDQRLQDTRARLEELEATARGDVAEADRSPVAQQLRRKIQELDTLLAVQQGESEQERTAIDQLQALQSQLETQSARLTRAIVAGEYLLDIDFRVCPRCGTSVERGRVQEGSCYLCLQSPRPQATREDLIREQDRITGEMTEVEQLIAAREERIHQIAEAVAEAQRQRERLSAELEQQTASFISDRAESIAERARQRAELVADTERLLDYQGLYKKLDQAIREAERLEERRQQIEVELERAQAIERSAQERVDHLERAFSDFVEQLGTPRFPGEPRAAIDPVSYLPIVNGRKFDELSSGGLKVLTNLAHALAHHIAALDLDVPLPGILILDGVTKNVGRDEYDWTRVQSLFRTLIALSEQRGDELQIIVAANDVPSFAEGHVRLRLSHDDLLIPNP